MKKSVLSACAVMLAAFVLFLAVSCEAVGEDPFFYEVTLKNGEEVISTKVVFQNDVFVLPDAPSVRGRVFEGWKIDGDAENIRGAGETVHITGTTLIEAVWGENIEKPDVSAVETTSNYKSGSRITLTPEDGTTFRWTLDGSEPSLTNGNEGEVITLSGVAGEVTVKVAAVKKGCLSETESFTVRVEPEIKFDRADSAEVAQNDSVNVNVPAGTAVYYTTDGSDPTTASSSGTEIPLQNEFGDVTIKILAVKDGVESRNEIKVNVATPGPQINAEASAIYKQSDSITLDAPSGAEVRYTFDGTDPTAATENVYDSANGISLSGQSGNVEIRTAVFKNGEKCSAVSSVTLRVQPTAPDAPTSAEAYSASDTISFSTLPEGTTIRYTTNGDTPTAESTEAQNGTIPLSGLSGKATLKYVALKDGIASEVKSFDVKVKPTVAFNRSDSAEVGQNDTVTVNVPEGTTVYYTLNGDNPTTSTTTTGTQIGLTGLLGSTAIKVLAVKDGVCSDVETLNILVKASAPEISEDTASTTYRQSDSISVNVPAGADVYYTINGDTPTASSSKYDSTKKISLSGYSGNVTVRTVAYKNGVSCSAVGTFTVRVQPTAPDYTVSGTAYSSTDKIEFSSLPTGTTIYYTTDGTKPSASSKSENDGKSISLSGLSGKKTIKYVAVKDGIESEVKTLDVSVKPTVTFDKTASAELKQSDSVSVTVPANTTVYYTTDGTKPTTSSATYDSTTGIPLTNALGTTTIKVLAVTDDEVEATSDLTVKVEIPGPVITVDNNKSYAQSDKLTVTVPNGTTVRYTTDGSVPNATTGEVYDSSTGVPLTGLSGEATIKAVIVKDNECSASPTTVTVKVKPAALTTPTLETKYSEDDSIAFIGLPSGTEVRYSLNDTEVTASSSLATDNKISLADTLGDADSKTVTVRAVAEKDGVISDEIKFTVKVKNKDVLTLNLGGGTLSEGVAATYSYVDSATVTLPASSQISKTGYAFDGWYKTETASTTGYISTSTYEATGDEQIYAVWISAGLTIDDSGEGAKVTSFYSATGEIVIPSVYHGKAVTEIAENAFYDSTAKTGAGITKITIPLSVTTIGNGAFQGCTSLTSADIQGTLTELPENAFSGCEKLQTVTLPDSLTTLGNSALKGTAITSINLKNVTSIGSSAFDGCKSLSSITMDKVTTIGSGAFSETAFTSFTVPSGVTKIDSSVFAGCSKLTSITFSGAITEIGEKAFQNCTGLTTFTVPDSVTSIGAYAFDGCTNLNTVTISKTGSKLQTIGEYAFAKTNLTSDFVVPESITSIGDNAFSNCTSSFTIDIDNVEGCLSNYDSSTKWGATNATVNWVDGYIITYSSNGGEGTIANQYVKKGNSVVLASADGYTKSGYRNDGWYTGSTASTTNYVEAGKEYTATGNVTLYACWIDEGVSFVENGTGWAAKASSTGVTQINIPSVYQGSTVNAIADNGFKKCSSLVSVIVPSSITSIGSYAFSYCTSLIIFGTSMSSIGISIPANVTSIKANAFEYCSSVTTLNFSTTNKFEILDNAFFMCSKLTSLSFPWNITYIGKRAFFGCSAVKTINFNTTYSLLTGIHDEAFASCGVTGEVVIPENVTYLGRRAFSSCLYMTSITIPSTMTSIGETALELTTALTSIKIKKAANSISGYATKWGNTTVSSITWNYT